MRKRNIDLRKQTQYQFYQLFIGYFVQVFHMDSNVDLYVYGALFLIVNFLVLFAIYWVLTVYDLRRLIEDGEINIAKILH